MGTEIETQMTEHLLNQNWGGNERGVCLQVTEKKGLGYITLTMEEAAALYNDLGLFIKREATRRQGLLREAIKQAKIDEATVFSEVANLSPDYMTGPQLAVTMVSRLCPKARHARITDSANQAPPCVRIPSRYEHRTGNQ